MMKKTIALIACLVAVVCFSSHVFAKGWKKGKLDGPDWNAFVIRNASLDDTSPEINDLAGGKKEFIISQGGMKAGWGTQGLNGLTIGEITQLAITRYDDISRYPAGSGAAVAPYFNIWVTDGAGKYAVIANEPSNPAFQSLFIDNGDGSFSYNLSYADLADMRAKVFETPGWNTNSSWVHSMFGDDPLTFADVASLEIGAPPVSYIQNGENGVGSGAPDELGTAVAYGFNWVFGDTQSNYVSGDEGYIVGFPAVAPPLVAKTWKIPKDFPTIQEAIDSYGVHNGDTILVYKGNHDGATVTKAVEIKGKKGAVIDGGPLLTTNMPCGTIVLNIGFFFPGAGVGSGASIEGFRFEDLAFPVFSRGADAVTVSKNKMSNPIQGVTNWNGNSWTITKNKITDLRTANGGGIGILIGGSLGGIYEKNVVSFNQIKGVMHIAECDGGGYDGTGIVLYADWRYGKSGAEALTLNNVFGNKISLKSGDPDFMKVFGIELSEAEPPNGSVICGNWVWFNNLRGTADQINLTPESLDDCNKIVWNSGGKRCKFGHKFKFPFGPHGAVHLD
jgi:hypothetical protein